MRTLSILAVLAALAIAVPTGHADDDAGTVAIRFENTPAGKVIAQIARMAGVNVIISPEVAGVKITVSLDGVPWRKALDVVALNIGAKVIEEDHGILRVVMEKGKRRLKATLIERRKRVDGVRSRYAEAKDKLAEAHRELEAAYANGATEKVDQAKARLAELETERKALEADLTRMADENARRTDEANRAAELAAARAVKARDNKASLDKLRAAEGYAELSPYAGRRKADPRLRYRAAVRLLDGKDVRRAEHLEQAAKSLRAAGSYAEAERAMQQARSLRAEAAAHYRGSNGTGDGRVLESVNALRQDVRALREQVAELTGLVRRLLDQRRAAPGNERRRPPGSEHRAR